MAITLIRFHMQEFGTEEEEEFINKKFDEKLFAEEVSCFLISYSAVN